MSKFNKDKKDKLKEMDNLVEEPLEEVKKEIKQEIDKENKK